MPRAAKERKRVLLSVGIFMLFGRWLDMYQMVMPANFPEMPGFGPWELAGILGPGGLFGFWALRTLGRHPIVAKNDPYLVESLNLHVS